MFATTQQRSTTLLPSLALGFTTLAFIVAKTGRDALFFQGSGGLLQLPLIYINIGAASLPLAIIFKPMLRFGWVYFICGGWRHGMRGYLRAVCAAMGEFLSLAKAWEKRHAQPCIDPPKQYQLLS